jgi:hypothetical protein
MGVATAVAPATRAKTGATTASATAGLVHQAGGVEPQRGISMQASQTTERVAPSDVRTLERAVSDVQYAHLYAELNEKAWSHLDTVLKIVQIGSALAVGAGVLGNTSAAVGPMALVVVAAATLQLALEPLRRSLAFRDARRKLGELQVGVWQLSVEELDNRFIRIEADLPRGFTPLGAVALRRHQRQLGAAEVVSLSWRERMFDAMV